MASLTGKSIKDGYVKILITDSDSGISSSLTNIEDGNGTASVLSLATGKALVAGTLYLNDEGGESISGDGSSLTLNSASDLNLTLAAGDINIPANIGLTFGDDGEKIEGDGTDLTITGNNINLTATADVIVPANVGVTFGTGEKIEGDNTDLTVTSGAKINLTATSDVVIPSGVGLILDGSGNEKIESDGTDITFSVGSGGDINIPANIGMTFGDDAEKIEGDGTDLTITGNNIKLTAAADVIIPSGIGLHFTDANEKIESDGTDLTINSGNDINLTATADVNIPVNVGLRFGDGAQHIETDNTDLTITSDVGVNINSPKVDYSNQATTIEVNNSADGYTFDGASDNILSIDGANNRVGIGTNSPDTTLEVVGSFAANGPSSTFVTFADGDGTPSVATGNIFKHHASTQTITMFDDGICGQIITVISTAAITYDVTSSNLKGGSTDVVTANGDVTQWVFDGTNWYLLAFMDVTDDYSSGF